MREFFVALLDVRGLVALVGGVFSDGVNCSGHVPVRIANDADRGGADVFAHVLCKLVDVARRQGQLGLDLGQARAWPDPELAVPGVSEELLGVAAG